MLLVGATPAHADDAKLAETLLAAGQKQMDAQRYAEAIALFDAARSLLPDRPGPYLYLGLAYAAGGRCRDAVPALEQYMKRKTSEAKPDASRALASCKAAVANEQSIAGLWVGDFQNSFNEKGSTIVSVFQDERGLRGAWDVEMINPRRIGNTIEFEAPTGCIKRHVTIAFRGDEATATYSGDRSDCPDKSPYTGTMSLKRR
jgi:tetratricopeptide (TPR) repeat protein